MRYALTSAIAAATAAGRLGSAGSGAGASGRPRRLGAGAAAGASVRWAGAGGGSGATGGAGAAACAAPGPAVRRAGRCRRSRVVAVPARSKSRRHSSGTLAGASW